MDLPTASRSGRVPYDLNKKLYTYEISDKIYKNEETPIPYNFASTIFLILTLPLSLHIQIKLLQHNR